MGIFLLGKFMKQLLILREAMDLTLTSLLQGYFVIAFIAMRLKGAEVLF
jgi:hypothetical protein